jgi:hypothetical protein
MDSIFVFPDIESRAIGWLTTGLDDFDHPCTVAGSVPKNRPSEFVTVQRTGGPQRDIVTDSAQVTFDIYADLASAACELANLVRGIVGSWNGTNVYRVQEFAGPVLMPDPLSKQSRYRFTASLDVRGRSLQPGGIS